MYYVVFCAMFLRPRNSPANNHVCVCVCEQTMEYPSSLPEIKGPMLSTNVSMLLTLSLHIIHIT